MHSFTFDYKYNNKMGDGNKKIKFQSTKYLYFIVFHNTRTYQNIILYFEFGRRTQFLTVHAQR